MPAAAAMVEVDLEAGLIKVNTCNRQLVKQRPTGNSLSFRRLKVTSIIEANRCGVRGTPLVVVAVYLLLICFRPGGPELTILSPLYRVRCINWARNGEFVPLGSFIYPPQKKNFNNFLGYSMIYLKFSIRCNPSII